MADDLSISSLNALTAVTNTVKSVHIDLDNLYNSVQGLSTHLNAALSGSALGQFEARFLCWLKMLSDVMEDMDDTYNALNQISSNASAAAAALAGINYTTPPNSASF